MKKRRNIIGDDKKGPCGAWPTELDLERHVLGTLDEQERQAVEEHLPTCVKCQMAVQDIRQMVDDADL